MNPTADLIVDYALNRMFGFITSDLHFLGIRARSRWAYFHRAAHLLQLLFHSVFGARWWKHGILVSGMAVNLII